MIITVIKSNLPETVFDTDYGCITAITFNLPQAVDTDHVCITATTFNIPQTVDIDYVCITAVTF